MNKNLGDFDYTNVTNTQNLMLNRLLDTFCYFRIAVSYSFLIKQMLIMDNRSAEIYFVLYFNNLFTVMNITNNLTLCHTHLSKKNVLLSL